MWLRCPWSCSCCGAPCEQPHCLELDFLSRRCASTHSDRHVSARLQPGWPNPHEAKLLGLRSPFCSHPAERATTPLPLCSSLQPTSETRRSRANPARPIGEKKGLFVSFHIAFLLVPEPLLIPVKGQAAVWWELQGLEQAGTLGKHRVLVTLTSRPSPVS